VPIERATVRVTTPAPITDVACFEGGFGSHTACSQAEQAGSVADFSQDNLGPSENVTVVAGFAKGAVPAPVPVLVDRFSFSRSFHRAFAVTPATLGISALLLVAILAALARLAWVTGRDRRSVGSPVDVAFATEGPEEGVGPSFHPFGGTVTPVELVPPDGLRPGQVDTLVDEVANTLDVTATIVDLAVRGYLRIDEITKKGWFVGRPDEIRRRWRIIGIVAIAVSLVVLLLLAVLTPIALVGLPLVVGAVLVLVGAGHMPRRTAKGTGVLRRVEGFRRFIDESEKERARFAEEQHLFSEYLPYAIVFGATEKWARAFAGLEAELPAPTWYGGPDSFSLVGFSHSIDGFAVTTAGTITSSPVSSGSGSSGFSGGFSGGGGGGGSW